MIKFFRKIRQNLLAENKFSKYLVYAIGEIILVVIGILIAVSINGWYENKKDVSKERELYFKIISDLDKELSLIKQAREEFKSHEDLHYHLFHLKNRHEKYNPEMPYGLLRWSVPFVPTFMGNYQNKIDRITNDLIRETVNNYFRLEQRAVRRNEAFEYLKSNLVRPYITTNGFVKAKDIYIKDRYKEIDTKKSIDFEALSTKLEQPEFDQILYELKVKTVSAIKHLEYLIEANRKLRKSIRKNLDQ